MCDKYTYIQNCYVKMYREEEKNIFADVSRVYYTIWSTPTVFQDYAQQFAEKNVRTFFGAEKHSKNDWDTISALPSTRNPYILKNWLKKTQILPEE